MCTSQPGVVPQSSSTTHAIGPQSGSDAFFLVHTYHLTSSLLPAPPLPTVIPADHRHQPRPHTPAPSPDHAHALPGGRLTPLLPPPSFSPPPPTVGLAGRDSECQPTFRQRKKRERGGGGEERGSEPWEGRKVVASEWKRKGGGSAPQGTRGTPSFQDSPGTQPTERDEKLPPAALAPHVIRSA